MNDKVVILADGDFPHHDKAQRLLCEAVTVVCCDRAYLRWTAFAACHAVRAKEVFAIGDGDSMPAAARRQLGDHFVAIGEQDDNDLTKAVHFCFARGWRAFTILGATGLREDHTLGNISLLAEYQRANVAEAAARQAPPAQLQMVTDFGIFTVAFGRRDYSAFPGQQVSLFSLVPDKAVSVGGLQYPIRQRTLLNWWQGTLNSVTGDSFWVEVAPGGILLVYQTHSDKDNELRYKGERLG